jgi:hypothetical protein
MQSCLSAPKFLQADPKLVAERNLEAYNIMDFSLIIFVKTFF